MGWIERQAIRVCEPLLRGRRRRTRRPSDNSALEFAKAKPLYGRADYAPFYLTEQERLRHMAIFGASGSGKSWSVISWILLHILSGIGCVVIDVHDTAQKLLHIIAREVSSGRMPESVLKLVRLFDPAYEPWITPVNPMLVRNWRDAQRLASAMIGILDSVWPDVKWGSRTKELTRNILLVVAECGLSLADIEPLLRSPATLRRYAQSLRNEEAKRYFLYRFLQLSRNMQLVYAEALLNRLTVFLSDDRIKNLVGRRENVIDLRTAIDERSIIIADFNKGEFLGDSSVLGSFALNSLKKAVFSRIDIAEALRAPVSIIIEEFPSFASSVTVEPFLNETRKFGAGLVLVAQSPVSLKGDLWHLVRTNCATQIYFRMSPEDARLVCSGFHGEERDMAIRRLTSLPVGEAMLLKEGASPMLLSLPRLSIPERLTVAEEELVERMRRNMGFSSEGESEVAAGERVRRKPQGDREASQRQPQSSPEAQLSLPPGYTDGSAS